MATDRYQRQILLPQLGEEGQRRLSASRIVLIGCGALGTVIAEQLVRAGIGSLTICDRDVVELTNLQRQTLFDEADAREGLPKSIAAARRLTAINSQVQVDPRVIDVNPGNVELLISDADLIIDGTDNAQTRYLLNDAAVKHSKPWIYGACVGTTGRVMTIIPINRPCLRCLFLHPPGPGELQTCDTAGVLASAAAITASLQVSEAIKLLTGDPSVGQNLVTFDLWPLHFRLVSTVEARRPDCPCCYYRKFEFLDNRDASDTATLCGRDTVQVRGGAKINLAQMSKRLETAGDVQSSAYFVRCVLRDSNLTLTLFPDGRALVHGTADPALARSIYARFVGS